MVSRFIIGWFFSYLLISSSFAQDLEEIIITAPLGGNFAVQHYSADLFESAYRVQETSPGMLSPYLGPFTGNQVDQHVNGLRFSNSYFRSGPNQYWGWIPLSFTDRVIVSDGGNVGGTLNRILSVPEDIVSISYDSSLNGVETTISKSLGKLSVGVNDVDRGNVRDSEGTVPNSSYNRRSAIAEYIWNDQNVTTFLHSKSDDLRRTDKWNGGIRITGPRSGQVYNYELQQYTLLSHNYSNDQLNLDLGYQNFKENVLNKTTRTQAELDVFNLNASYEFNALVSAYTTNQFENIDYETIDVSKTSDTYNTYKSGVRFSTSFEEFDAMISLGYKVVDVSEVETFKSPEYSLIVTVDNYFISYDNTSNAPSYTSIKKDKVTGRGTVIPNSSLDQEFSETWRVGYQSGRLYLDLYYKNLKDAYDQITIAQDTFQIVNGGWVESYGASLQYSSNDFMNTGVSITSRVELVEATKSIANSTETEPTSKTPPGTFYLIAEKDDYFIELSYQPKDHDLAFKDLDDVRIFEHNRGYRIINVGKSGNFYGQFEYTFSINNILNDHGRVLGSSVDVPGRGIYFNLSYMID